jgi:hypothetical protein
VAEEIEGKTGTHSRLADSIRCAACHSDHNGQGFDLTASALLQFDHSRTRFNLVWHQIDYDIRPMDCSVCHHTCSNSQVWPRNASHYCHMKSARFCANTSGVWSGCLDCHDGQDRLMNFDHLTVAFQLDGAHSGVSCAACHGLPARWQKAAGMNFTDAFKSTPLECAGCHSEPPAHQGVFSNTCADCHTTSAWLPAQVNGQPFQHDRSTGFSLARHLKTREGQPMVCTDCHTRPDLGFELESCRLCHARGDEGVAFMTKHDDLFGPACLDCHDGKDRLSNFDHARFFPLEGQHAQVECLACHADRIYRGTPQDCASCHAEPAIHAGFFGLQCQYCHTAQAWRPAELRQHRFPISHGAERPLDCKACHADRYDSYTCYGCHEHQPEAVAASHGSAGIQAGELLNCATCHPDGDE